MFQCGGEISDRILFQASMSGNAEILEYAARTTRLIDGCNKRITEARRLEAYGSLLNVLAAIEVDAQYIERLNFKGILGVDKLTSLRAYSQALIEEKKVETADLRLLSQACSEMSRLCLDAYDNPGSFA
ncbi:MAG: hypothetical protein AABX19_03475 [Nanoarchaeota archaeon]